MDVIVLVLAISHIGNDNMLIPNEFLKSGSGATSLKKCLFSLLCVCAVFPGLHGLFGSTCMLHNVLLDHILHICLQCIYYVVILILHITFFLFEAILYTQRLLHVCHFLPLLKDVLGTFLHIRIEGLKVEGRPKLYIVYGPTSWFNFDLLYYLLLCTHTHSCLVQYGISLTFRLLSPIFTLH